MYTQLDGLVGLDTDQVRKFIDIAYRVVQWNGNRKGVRDRIVEVATSYDALVSRHAVKRHSPSVQVQLYGCCWYSHYWDGAQRKMITTAIIYLAPHRSLEDTVTTLTHEIAHALTQGSHGFTWRRMYAMLLPLAAVIFNLQTRISYADDVYETVARYAVRTNGSYVGMDADEQFVDRESKLSSEVDKHLRAALRCTAHFARFL